MGDIDLPPFEVVALVAQSLVDYGMNTNSSWECANRIVENLHIRREQRWIPTLSSGVECGPLPTFSDAERAMSLSPDVLRIDREFRIASRWFRPSRDRQENR